ncbi:hypothetical protein Bca4012_047165 [Brassica carinata]
MYIKLSLIFRNHSVPHHTVAQAFEDADLWKQAQFHTAVPDCSSITKRWSKPPEGSLKCNVGSSWISSNRPCGVSWILRDSRVYHPPLQKSILFHPI